MLHHPMKTMYLGFNACGKGKSDKRGVADRLKRHNVLGLLYDEEME